MRRRAEEGVLSRRRKARRGYEVKGKRELLGLSWVFKDGNGSSGSGRAEGSEDGGHGFTRRSEAGNHRACLGTGHRPVWREQRPRTESRDTALKLHQGAPHLPVQGGQPRGSCRRLCTSLGGDFVQFQLLGPGPGS